MRQTVCYILLFLLTGCASYMYVSEADCIKNRGGICYKKCSKIVSSGGVNGCLRYVWIESGAYLMMACSYGYQGKTCNAYGVGGVRKISALEVEGFIERRKKQRLKTIQLQIKAIQESPKDAEAHYKLGMTYYYDSQFKMAMQEYSEAIKLDPNIEPAYRYRSELYVKYKDYNAALKDIRKAIELESNADSYRERGHIYRKIGEYNLALEDFDKAIEISMLTEGDDSEIQRGNAYYDKANLYMGVLNNTQKGCAAHKKHCDIMSNHTSRFGSNYNPCGPYKRLVKKGVCY